MAEELEVRRIKGYKNADVDMVIFVGVANMITAKL